MTSEEFEAAYRAFRRRRPFFPYEIELVSGTIVRVSHPETIRKEGTVWMFKGARRLRVIIPVRPAKRRSFPEWLKYRLLRSESPYIIQMLLHSNRELVL